MEEFKLLLKMTLELLGLFLNPIILIPIIIIFIRYYTKVKKYKEETYYKITQIPYSKVRNDTGKYGEYLTYKYLKEFEDKGAKFLFNIYVPPVVSSKTLQSSII